MVMEDLKFGNLKIGGENPCVIIAEIGVAHMGDMKKAKRMIEMAKDIGADVAKFQIHLPDIEMAPIEIKFHGGTLNEVFKKSHFTGEQHKELKDYCREIGIEYLCTPFCPASVDLLNDVVGVGAFKTGSGEITNLPHQRKIARISAKTGKPVFVSTGMCTMEEIADTVEVYKEENAHFMLLNCTSEYPPNNYADINLGLIPILKERFGVWVGQSDHTTDNYISFGAVALGAKVIEKHLTLSRYDIGCDDFMALEPQMFKDLVAGIRKIEAAMGAEKNIRAGEWFVRDWAFHSVVANRKIKKGEKITLAKVRPARPGSGIPAKFLDKKYSGSLLGRKIRKGFPKNSVIRWEDIC